MESSAPRKLTTRCVVAGGGPAGMMLGYLLARAGIRVVVLEKHKDFFRDFRGDTIHPSTLELMHELGLLDAFLKVPHQRVEKLMLSFEGTAIEGPDFSSLPVHCGYIAMMPQWDFLNFLAEQAKAFPSFTLLTKTEVTDLIEEQDRIVGVIAKDENGPVEIRAELVFGTAGRHSIIREKAGFVADDFGVPIDVLWFRVPKTWEDPQHFLGRVKQGQMMVTIDRGDYYQSAILIPKGAFEDIKKEGLEAFRKRIVSIVPGFADAVKELDDWEKVKLLTVQINRLREWCRPGLLCIGDAAHAMSPAGGVGINFAVQDAVAAANLLCIPLLRGECGIDDLRAVQQRREWPAKMMQGVQVFIHRNMFRKDRDPSRAVSIPWVARKFFALVAPLLRFIAARIVGIGFRAEHIHSPAK